MTIDVYFERLTENRKAEMRITRSIVSEDMMADEASPACRYKTEKRERLQTK